MNKYELMVIYNSDLKDSEVKTEINTIKDKITTQKGEIHKDEFWGLKDFAYQIGKYNKGFYQLFEFSIDPSKISELSRWLSNQEKTVVRNMVIKLSK